MSTNTGTPIKLDVKRHQRPEVERLATKLESELRRQGEDDQLRRDLDERQIRRGESIRAIEQALADRLCEGAHDTGDRVIILGSVFEVREDPEGAVYVGPAPDEDDDEPAEDEVGGWAHDFYQAIRSA